MILGSNNSFNRNNGNMFKQNNNLNKPSLNNHKNNNKHMSKNNIFVKDLQSHAHTNAANTNDMYDKTLSLLNERLNNNQISLEDFNKQCEKLGKLRNNK